MLVENDRLYMKLEKEKLNCQQNNRRQPLKNGGSKESKKLGTRIEPNPFDLKVSPAMLTPPRDRFEPSHLRKPLVCLVHTPLRPPDSRVTQCNLD